MLLATLPIRDFPSKKAGDTFAIILSGDGGWRRIDKQLTRELNEHGVSVVGFNTPAYRRHHGTPEVLEQIIRDYRTKWQRPRVILIGYSRGADLLPFMASRLTDKSNIDLIALLGIESTSELRAEVEKLRGQRILCVYGEREKDSLCPVLDPALATRLKMKGAHHFAGHYKAIAEAILKLRT